MKNLEALLGDVLEARTGLRRPPYPEAGQETPFQKRCVEVALSVAASREFLLSMLRTMDDAFDDTILVGDNQTGTGIDILIRSFVTIIAEEYPETERALILRFLRPAIDAVCVVAFALNAKSPPMPPSAFEGKKNAVATAAELLAGYPDEVSGAIKHRIGKSLVGAMEGDDVSDAFRRETAAALTNPRWYPREDAQPRLRRSCPAHPGVYAFASAVMDLFLDVYRRRYERLQGDDGAIAPETIERLMEESFERAFLDGGTDRQG